MHYCKQASFFILTALILLSGFFAIVSHIGVKQAFAETEKEKQERLEAQLKDVEQQILDQQVILDHTKDQAASISRDIAILDAEINEAKLKIQAHNINIQQLGKDINEKVETISGLDNDLQNQRNSLASLLERTDQEDRYSLVEVLLSNKSLSGFFDDLNSYQILKSSLNQSVVQVKNTKSENEVQKVVLGQQKNKETDAKFSVEAEQKIIKQKEAQKQRLLDAKNSEAASYEEVIEQRQNQAAQIRAALFALRDTSSIPFGEALTYANTAFAKTGVRPAFLLAILKQESNIGQNVGTCNRPGDPPEKQWKAIMPGPTSGSWRDDQTAFLRITKALGITPESMPLSCPFASGGWGGAMGPAQFIPTTWESYEHRVESLLGEKQANPWSPKDAFMASALYLADLGAGGGGYTAERTAALKYYAGSNWSLPKNAFYGDGVMRNVQDIQTNMIDPLQNI